MRCCLFILLVITAVPAGATRIRRMSLREIRDSASAVLVVKVLASSVRIGEANMVWTDYRVRLEQDLRGMRRAGEMLTLPFAGGRAAGLSVGIGGVPQLDIGSRYVIFVDDTPARPVPAVGWGQGIFQLSNATGERLASIDGENLEIGKEGSVRRVRTRGVEIDRKSGTTGRLREPVVTDADGSAAPVHPKRHEPARAGPRRSATLDDLRRFVQGLITEGQESVSLR